VKPSVIIDSGPLVALINARDANHAWTVGELKKVAGPVLTCEAVISEAIFLLRRLAGGTGQIVGMLRTEGLRVAFCLDSEMSRVCDLLTKYADIPISLADASLVRMSELYPRHLLMTFDSDFSVYRRNRRQRIPLITL
jgi:uncharacterized protein